jgi:hypothetical protein
METDRQAVQNSIRWFIPALALVLVFGMAARVPVDSDLWWHLRAGQANLEQGRPVLVDLFSHTRFGEDWTNHSWLAQIILYVAFMVGGHLALAGLVAALAAASLGLVYAQMEGHPILGAFILVLAAAVAAPVWSPRPQMFSLMLFAALGYLLDLYRRGGRDRLWLVPPLFILWSNLHGGYVLGLLLIAATAAGMAFDRLFGSADPATLPWGKIARLASWGILGGLVVVANPNGLAMWAIPFRTVGVGVLRELISEWASPDFHEITQQPFLWMLFLTLGSAALSRRRPSGIDLFAVFGFAYLSLIARRNFGPFALVAAPVLSRHLPEVLSPLVEKFERWVMGWKKVLRNDLQQAAPLQISPRVRKALNLAILAFLSGAAFLKLLVVTSPQLVSGHIDSVYPAAATRWIEENHPPGKIFNDYNWGGYLTWFLRDYPVFVDGRTDLYDDELLRSYLTAVRGESGWEEILVANRVNLVLVQQQAVLARELARSPAWQAAYQDENAAVYLRKEVIPP